MDELTPEYLLYGSIFLYLAAVFAAILFSRRHNICTVTTQALCIAASLAGAASAATFLLSGQEGFGVTPFEASVPFIRVTIAVDHLSALFLLMLSILTFCVSIYSIGYLSNYYGKRNIGLFHFLYSSFILSMILVFTADDAIYFFLTWELMAVISYFLVVFESEQEENRRAGLVYVVMTHLGSAFLLIAFMLMYYYTNSFSLSPVSTEQIPESGRNLLFLLFLIGFGTKAGIIPLHIWLPYAYPAAPGNISALMSGIMSKTAVYGLLRFVFLYLGITTPWWGTVILLLGVSSAIFGVLYAYIEQNIQRLIAYSSIENMGIIFIGLGTGFLSLSQGNNMIGALALTAALLHCFNHSLFKGGLFLGIGSVHYATNTKNLEELGGLIKRMPLTSVFVLVCALSISAVVPFNGFIGEWLTYQAIFAGIASSKAALSITYILSAAALALTGALAAACFIKLFGITFLGLPRSKKAAEALDVPLTMNMGVGILASLCLVAGLFPQFIISFINRPVIAIAKKDLSDVLHNGFLGGYCPLRLEDTAHEAGASSLFIFLAGAIIIVMALVLMRLMGGKYRERSFGTWDCGFKELNSRMQYSGTAFSKPIQIAFKIFYQSSRELRRTGEDPYHPVTMNYEIRTESLFEKYFYVPILTWVTSLSKRLKFMIQTGSVHTYLLYIFITVLVLMLYNRIG